MHQLMFSNLDPLGDQVHADGLLDHLVIVTSRHPVPAAGHVAVVAPCLDPTLGAVLEKFLEARLLQCPVEVVGQVEILEGELVAPGTELGSTECRLLPHGVLFESLVGDPRGVPALDSIRSVYQ